MMLLLVILLLFLLCGGGWGYAQGNQMFGHGALGLIILIVVLYLLFGHH